MPRPSLTNAQIQNDIQKIKQVRTRNIDGEVLANMAGICHTCALKNHEVHGLNIGDVSKSGTAYNTISIKGVPIPISVAAQGIVQNHINHLKKSGYRLYPRQPIFPQKKSGLRYTNKSFNNHIDKCLNDKDSGFRLENIRQAGIRDHFNNLLNRGISADQCLELTADFARVDKQNPNEMRYLKNLLDHRIPGSGNKPLKPGDFAFHLDKIENAHNHRRKNIASILERLEQIKYGITTKQKYNKYEELDTVWAELNNVDFELRKEPKLDDEEKVKSVIERLDEVKNEINELPKSSCEEKIESNLEILNKISEEIVAEPKLSDKEKILSMLNHLEDLRNEITNEPKLTGEEKKLLNDEINHKIVKTKKSFTTENKPVGEAEFKSVADFVKNFTERNNDRDSTSMDWVRYFGYDVGKQQSEQPGNDKSEDPKEGDEIS
ncbi:MAG: hypothetical protein V2J65_32020 [Desulfobacteraceae bacterium]|jgi:hypothetical protein|nr:hypothetical protein [Desulfobacteraceae bacterium]